LSLQPLESVAVVPDGGRREVPAAEVVEEMLHVRGPDAGSAVVSEPAGNFGHVGPSWGVGKPRGRLRVARGTLSVVRPTPATPLASGVDGWSVALPDDTRPPPVDAGLVHVPCRARGGRPRGRRCNGTPGGPYERSASARALARCCACQRAPLRLRLSRSRVAAAQPRPRRHVLNAMPPAPARL